MSTKQPEALRLAEWFEGIRGRTWPSCTPQEAAAELRRLHTEIQDLRAQLEAIGAGGVNGPLMTPLPVPQPALSALWMPIETAPKYTEHGAYYHLLLGYAPDEIHEDGFVSQGYWMEAEEDAPDNMGHDGGWVDVHFDFFSCGRSFGAEAYRSAGTQPTHWIPLPLPPTSAEGVEHG